MLSHLWRCIPVLSCLLCSFSLALMVNTEESGYAVSKNGLKDIPRQHCVGQQQWVGSGIRAPDCLGTLHKLYKMAEQTGDELFEFVATHIEPSHRYLRPISTPFKFQTCEYPGLLTKCGRLIKTRSVLHSDGSNA